MLHSVLGPAAEYAGVLAPWDFFQLYMVIQALFHMCVIVQGSGPPLSKSSFVLPSVSQCRTNTCRVTGGRGVRTVQASRSSDVAAWPRRHMRLHSAEVISLLFRDLAALSGAKAFLARFLE